MPQVFFLTGSSRGLGRQIAEAALAAGHQLVATARRPETLADLADRYGGRILPVGLDVTDSDAAAAAVRAGAEASRSPRSAGAWRRQACRPTRRPSGRSVAFPKSWRRRSARWASRSPSWNPAA